MVEKSSILFYCKGLDFYLKHLVGQLPGIIDGADVECVHQARVASRRLRVGLKLAGSGFPAKKVKKWRKYLKKITKTYGPARDLDVQILYLQKVINDDIEKIYRPGIERLLLRLQQRRHEMQDGIRGFTEKLQQSAVLQQMAGDIEKVMFDLAEEDMGEVSLELMGRAKADIDEKVEALGAFSGWSDHKDESAWLHSMRIAVKRLRYRCEFYVPVIKELKGVIKVLKKMQTRLGELHDFDVWQVTCAQFLDEEYERTRAYFGHTKSFSRLKTGIEYLHHRQRREREAALTEFEKCWRQYLQLENAI